MFFRANQVPDYAAQAAMPFALGHGLTYGDLRRTWRHLKGAAQLLDPTSW